MKFGTLVLNYINYHFKSTYIFFQNVGHFEYLIMSNFKKFHYIKIIYLNKMLFFLL